MNLKASRPLENEKWSKNNDLQRDIIDHRHLVNRIFNEYYKRKRIIQSPCQTLKVRIIYF